MVKKNIWLRCSKNTHEIPLVESSLYIRRQVTYSICECFCILIKLWHSKGATSFADLRTVQGQQLETFKRACMQLGLLQNNNEWDQCFTDAADTKLCAQLRTLFVTMLLFCNPANPTALFDKHYHEWYDDLIPKWPRQCSQSWRTKEYSAPPPRNATEEHRQVFERWIAWCSSSFQNPTYKSHFSQCVSMTISEELNYDFNSLVSGASGIPWDDVTCRAGFPI